MAMVPIWNGQPGPLPLKATFKSPTDAGATITVSGSLRSTGAPVITGFQILVDGNIVGVSHIWSNADNVHRATVPVNIPAPKDFKPHTLLLQPLNSNSIGDINDYFTAVLDY
ncbi:MAG TPA: hypothetical protein VKS01_13045 [Bryobacteraceae bacterium]|nr:hypothetical protein [Bryobacteraceae bacterium]